MTLIEPLISFIIPCYNDAQYIEQSVASALGQTYKNIEVIVIDDGSNLKTKKVLQSLKPSITHLITQENQGQSAARNRGIEAANGEFIVTLDSDDYFEPSFAEKVVKSITGITEVKIVTCYSNLLYDDGRFKIYKPNGGDINHFMFSNGAMGSSMFRKADWLSSGGYDETMRKGWEDWEFYIRLLKNNGKAIVIDQVLFNYRRRGNSTTTRANNNKTELYKHIFLKHSDVYKDNFKELLDFFLSKQEASDAEIQKVRGKLDYKLGNSLLRPLRLIKQLLN